MSRIRLTILVGLLTIPAIARAADGGVHLYLQPLPSEAARLSFTIASVSAVAGSGAEHALKLRFGVVRNPDAGRQRLLATGRLPIGSYTGFVFTIKQAALQGNPREAALAVGEAPVRLDVPFVVAGHQATVLWLTLRYRESVPDGFSFAPAFEAARPPKAIPDYAGFVTNSGSDTITVFDRNLTQAVAVIDTCAGPAGMALDRRRRRVYVACSKDDEIQAIDAATGGILERSRLSPGDRPHEIALTPDGATLVSANQGSNSISLFDAESLTRQERIAVGSGPASVLIDFQGRRALAFNTLSNSISVVDLASRSLVATVSTDSSPLRGKFNRRGDRLYVIHERSPYMTVLDSRQLTVITRARLRIGVTAIEVDPVRDLVCIGGSNDRAIEFYDPNALMPLYAMRTPSGVSYITIGPSENALYMLSPATRSLLVARLADRKVVSEIDVDETPYWVVVTGEK